MNENKMTKDNHRRSLLDQTTRRAILSFLRDRGISFNAEIAKSLVKQTGEVGFDESTIIRDIKKLKLNGYIEEISQQVTDKKKYYSITEKGIKAIGERMNTEHREYILELPPKPILEDCNFMFSFTTTVDN